MAAFKRPAASNLDLDSEESLKEAEADFVEDFSAYEEEGKSFADDVSGNERVRLTTAIRAFCHMAISTSQNGKLKFADGDKETIKNAVVKAMKCLDNEVVRDITLQVGAFEVKKKELEDVVSPIVNARLATSRCRSARARPNKRSKMSSVPQ